MRNAPATRAHGHRPSHFARHSNRRLGHSLFDEGDLRSPIARILPSLVSAALAVALTESSAHRLYQRLRFAETSVVQEGLRALRAVPYLGTRRVCPCCGWRVREFIQGGLSLRHKATAFCPRCNSKARHRWLWLHLAEHTDVFETPQRVLEVAPAFCISRRLQALPHLRYVGGDLKRRAHVQLRMDAAALPFASESFDLALSIHVLEHVPADRQAMAELHRVLRPGGTCVFSVPVRMDRPTFEDPSIVTAEARKRAFGEREHVRWYGYDVVDRLTEAGFEVKTTYAKDVPKATSELYGIRDYEVIFSCSKAGSPPAARP
jgi:SAM-dependent methyltransferase